MINLNDKQFENNEVKIFNGGEAGVVKDCAVRIEKKTADDAENAPAYKLIVTDDSGAEVNQGFFDDPDGGSEAAQTFFVKSMKHVAGVFKVQDQLPAQVGSLKELLDTTMKLCNKNQNNVKVNVAVCYGNEKRPSNYIRIDWFWGLKNVEDGIPTLSKTALTTRPAPDSDGPDIQVGGGAEDAGGVADDWA